MNDRAAREGKGAPGRWDGKKRRARFFFAFLAPNVFSKAVFSRAIRNVVTALPAYHIALSDCTISVEYLSFSRSLVLLSCILLCRLFE